MKLALLFVNFLLTQYPIIISYSNAPCANKKHLNSKQNTKYNNRAKHFEQ